MGRKALTYPVPVKKKQTPRSGACFKKIKQEKFMRSE